MKGQPIHQNLSTSFVDLAALVDHLRGMQFTGTVRVELSSYEAEIIFAPKNRVQSREYDKLIGRISQGEDVLKRILKRAEEPFGRVSVVQADAKETVKHIKKAFVDDRIVAEARAAVFGRSDRLVGSTILGTNWVAYRNEEPDANLELATELLMTMSDVFDETEMNSYRINFDDAFRNACAFASDEFPFLDPRKGLISFCDGELTVNKRIYIVTVFEGIMAAYKHIFGRLRENADIRRLLVFARLRLKSHYNSRKREYTRIGIAGAIEEMIA